MCTGLEVIGTNMSIGTKGEEGEDRATEGYQHYLNIPTIYRAERNSENLFFKLTKLTQVCRNENGILMVCEFCQSFDISVLLE